MQRVSRARVTVDAREVASIGRGILALVGVMRDDDETDARRLAEKTARLRIFDDADGRMNRSALDEGCAVLAVSQFTLCAQTSRGLRPSYTEAAEPARARALLDRYVACLRDTPLPVSVGEFQAHMRVELVNDGPVTLWLDSRSRRSDD